MNNLRYEIKLFLPTYAYMKNLKNDIRPYKLFFGCAMKTWFRIKKCDDCPAYTTCIKVSKRVKQSSDSMTDIIWTVI